MAVYKIKIYDSSSAAVEQNIGAYANDVIMADGQTTLATTINNINNSITNLDKNKASTNVATKSTAGLLSASDKIKLDDIAPNANNYVLPEATTSSLGGVKIGAGLIVSAGKVELDKATTASVGGVQIGNGLSVSNGVASLATASASQLGGVKIGSGLSISDGVVSLNLPTATNKDLGGVKIGDGILINDGVISANVRDIGTSVSAGHILVNFAGNSRDVKVAGWDDVQTASDMIKNGAFTKAMKALVSDDKNGMIRNIQFTDQDPTANQSGYDDKNGLLICVYE